MVFNIMNNVSDKQCKPLECGSHKQVIVAAKQANHYSFILPEELWGIEEKSLYMCIALWSFMKKDYICCDDIASAFGISSRQASNILSMIHRRYSDNIICKIKRFKSGGSNVIKTHVLVTGIIKQVSKKTKKQDSKLVNSSDLDASLKKFILHRKIGERISI